MSISIAIATYNRAAELRLTLMSLTQLRPACEYEILVIANRCTDDTVKVAHDLEPIFAGRLRCIEEMRQGLSHARNRAIADARFPIVAFLDDDVDVDPGWLEAMDDAWKSGDYAAVGGRASLVYPTQRPSWLGDLDEGYLTKVELGPTRRPAQLEELFGVNLSLRIDWIRRVGGFRPDLGRVGGNLIGDEEGELLERTAKAGGALLYEPGAFVGHRVAPSRLKRKWFWRRCFDGHRGLVRAFPPEKISGVEVLRATWRLGRSTLSGLVAMVTRGPMSQGFFHASTLVASRAGVWVGMIGRFASSHCRNDRLAQVPIGEAKV